MKNGFDTESEMATAFMEHLQGLGWDCYPEVAVNRGGSRADLVAYRKPLLWVIEAKLSFNEKVCEQANAWLRWAHWVTVLVPHARHNGALREWCELKGIGIMTATRHEIRGNRYVDFQGSLEPKLHRHAHKQAAYVVSRLHPDMKRYAPGTNSSFSSPWTRTMDAAVATILRSPGIGVKDIVGAIKHHYHTDKSARACLLQWLQVDKRVRFERAGRALRFFAPDVTKNTQQESAA